MTSLTPWFDSSFEALTDHRPLHWQRRLFLMLSSGQVPTFCNLATGLGKTSVIPIWLLALAWQADHGSVTLPRRLVYVVNRRTVVDQATGVVERMRERLLAPVDPRWSRCEDVLRGLARALKTLASTDERFLAVSTLRGELADNEEWKADPARPAIIVGTVDMIGSKLLFSGYGDGRYWRAQHAGLVGQDALIVHDEAHLTPAFGEVLRQVAAAQRRIPEPRPVQIMELTATSRAGTASMFQLTPEDENDQFVRNRLDATKWVRLHEVGHTDEEMIEKLVNLSVRHEDQRAKVLVYVRSPETAKKVLDGLNRIAGGDRTGLLTGTIRGYERDQLVRGHQVYRAFLEPARSVEQTVYLVSTSAGEVGIDIDADHMVCDSTTLESMVQRLGRVNRAGGVGRAASVDVVLARGDEAATVASDGIAQAIATTEGILREWTAGTGGPVDLSPRNLRARLNDLEPQRREDAFAPEPRVPPLTDILLDGWALTTVNEDMPGRPAVAEYLHGLEAEPPETFVAWRKEVELLASEGVDEEGLTEWFQACRILTHERLRDRTDRVRKTLDALLRSHRKSDALRDFPVVVLTERGQATLGRLSEIVTREFNLAYRTVVLPVEIGGLDRGALDPGELTQACDVAEELTPGIKTGGRERWVLREEHEGRTYQRLQTGDTAEQLLVNGLREHYRLTLQERPEGAEGGGTYLLLLIDAKQAAVERPETVRVSQRLDVHLDETRRSMERISRALRLNSELAEALAAAAASHDIGKNRRIWQWYACNRSPDAPLAKSEKYLHGRFLAGYRHEFGSLLDAVADETIRGHPQGDLVLHLIAAHHGWGRPHFRPEAWDNSYPTAKNEDTAADVVRRFGRLQHQFGRWGLAWLEALLRCADMAASAPAMQVSSPT